MATRNVIFWGPGEGRKNMRIWCWGWGREGKRRRHGEEREIGGERGDGKGDWNGFRGWIFSIGGLNWNWNWNWIRESVKLGPWSGKAVGLLETVR